MDRPQFHFTPNRGWINDPNGLVYFANEYHLFYQHDPYSAVGGGDRMHWGHATSHNLVDWQEQPVALAPDDLGTIWSGSAVVDWHDTSGFFGGKAGLVACYTQWQPARQVQSLAYSTDNGHTWIKYAENPIITAPELTVFRDPKVWWHASTDRWVLVVTIGQSVRFYTSPNLREWQAAGEFGTGHGAQAGVWECPDLFPLSIASNEAAERWVLLISTNGPTGSQMEYFIGDFDGEQFTSDYPAATVLPFDYGRDCYAAVTWSDIPATDRRRLAIGWMNNWQYARALPGDQWRGAMTIPRSLQLAERPTGLRLIQQPIAELAARRGIAHHYPARTITPEATAEPDLDGKALEIVITLTTNDAAESGLRVRTDATRGATIGYDWTTECLFIERSEAVPPVANFAGRQEAPLAPTNGSVTLQIFLDYSSIEIIADAGAVVLSALVFLAPHDGTTFYSKGGATTISALEVYPLTAES